MLHRVAGAGIVVLLLVISTARVAAQADRVTVHDSEHHQFVTSAGVTYDLYVALPEGYDAEGAADYPVLYVTDAEPNFALVSSTHRLLRIADEAQPLIIVGINRAGWETASERASLRPIDFTPTRSPEQEQRYLEIYGLESSTGGAAAFFRALTQEVVPWIDSRYRTSESRGIVGHSLAGLFATFALLTEPGAFDAYLIISPSLWWDHPLSDHPDFWSNDPIMFELERDYAAEHNDLAARVYLSVGTDEPFMVPVMAWLNSVLEFREYPNLELEYHVAQGETHFSIVPGTISRGLRWLYATGQPSTP